ncbi:antitoxin YezG family protein [Nocardiopsis sp. SBT366]|uniref:antitoxin YezG family protein n=1 Tax=Nocardiopsis sp. SBT366 TaxID=1580529 RepID=UPI000A462B2D|nr:antitoxin YezG family protein [Nocardiopsis sp. SBT366]
MSSHTPETSGIPDPVRQGETLESIAASLAAIMPENWQNVTYGFWRVGGFSHEDVVAASTDGSVLEFPPPPEATQGALALKDLFHEAGKGTWLSMTLSLEAPGKFRAEYNHDTDPGLPEDVAPVAYLQELRRYPRGEDTLPQWWSAQLQRARPEDLDRLYADFGADLAAACREVGLSAEHTPPTSVSLQVPGIGALPDSDLRETFERAAVSSAEARSGIAASVANHLLDSAREQGILSALTADGAVVVSALRHAFHEVGAQASFQGINTLVVQLPDGPSISTDIGSFRSGVEGATPEQVNQHASAFARAALEQFAQATRNNQAVSTPASGRLKVRLYPASAFPEDVPEQLLAREIAPGLWQTVVIDSPESLQPLSRVTHERSGRPDAEVFTEAVASALEEPVEASEHELSGARIVHLGAQHPYVAAQAHALDRFVGEAPHGVLVAFPVPEVILAHPLGQGHPIAGMDHLGQLAQRFVEDAEKPISPQLYWWHPGSRDRALGEPLDLRPVGMTLDHETRSVTLHTSDDEFVPLVDSLARRG